MADVKFRTTRANLPTTAIGTTFDITIPGFGTPKAALFFTSSTGTDDTITAINRIAIGFTDGTRQFCNGIYVADGKATSSAGRWQRSNRVISLGNTGSTENMGFAFNAWVTDGVQLVVSKETAGAQLVTCVLIGGADVSDAYVNFNEMSDSAAVDIIAPGFEPDLLLLTSIGYNTAPSAGYTDANLSFGACVNDGADTQRVAMVFSDSASAVADTAGYIANTSAVGKAADNGALTWAGTVGAFDASGFSVTPSANASTNYFGYLALKFSGAPDIALFDTSIPTSGNYVETGAGFTPDFGLIASVVGPATRNAATDANCYSLGLTAFDSAAVFTTSVSDQDAADTTVAKSLSSPKLRLLRNDGATDAVVSSAHALTSSGWDFTLSTNPPAPILGWGLAVGAGGGLTAVSADADLRWQALNAIEQDVQLQWSLLNALFSDADARWNILSAISADADLRWNLLAGVFQNSDLRWGIDGVAGTIQVDTDLRWAVLNAAEQALTAQWDIFNGVEQSVEARWNLLNAASNDADIRWAVLNAVQQDGNLQWSLLNAALNDSDLRWQVLNAVSADADLRWSLLETVLADVDLRWDLSAAAGTVSASVDLRWNILAAVYQSLTAQWNLFNRVTQDADLRWQLLNTISNDAALQWAIRQSASAGVDLRWDIVSATDADITLRWSIESLTQFPDLMGTITLTSDTPVFSLIAATPVISFQSLTPQITLH